MVRQYNRTIAIVLALLLVVLQMLPVHAQNDSTAGASNPPLRIGSGPATTDRLLSKMIAMVLQEAGYPIQEVNNFDDSAAERAALVQDELDLYPEYSGAALTLYNDLPVEALPNAAERVYELAKTLDEPRAISWLAPAPMNRTPVLLVNAALAGQGITSIEALAEAVNQDSAAYTICLDGEFYAQPAGLQALETIYDLHFPEENILIMESDEVYTNLQTGVCNVGQGVSTDGRIDARKFVVLDDALGAFYFDQPAPVLRTELLTTYPDLPSLLDPLMATIDVATIRELDASVEVGDDGLYRSGDEAAIDDVVVNFLTTAGFLKPAPIRVGSKEFTEQLILGKLMVLLLRDAGFEVEDMTGVGGTTLIRQMVEAGDIDIYPEYTGTATSIHHGIPVTALPTTAERAYVLAKSLDAPQGLIWLEPMAFNNTYTILARPELIADGIQTIDDLAAYMNANDSPLTICVEDEFYARPDGLDGLQTLYGFAFPEENILVVETGDVYEKLRDGECDLGEGYATDGRINAWGFASLTDSLAFFPFYNPTPVVRKEVLDLHPEIAGLLNQLSELLDEQTMSELNAQVDIGPDGKLASGDEATVDDVAYNFLREHRLVALPQIVVATTDITESFQALVSNMLMLLLADAGYQPVDKTNLGGHLAVRAAMLKGDVDIYVETVVTALAEYHNLPIAALPTTRERAYALAQNLDRENDVVWLDLLPYAETLALVEGETLVDQDIAGLDDLASYMVANDAPLAICMDNDFYASELNGIDALQELYGFAFKPENILLMEKDALLDALGSGQCDIAAANSLDALARGYTILNDPLGFFLASGSAPVVRKSVLDQNPDLAGVINGLAARLDAETVAELDRSIELGPDGEAGSGDELEPYAVARDFLVNAGLIAPPVEEPAATETAPSDEAAAPADSGEDDNGGEAVPATDGVPSDETPSDGTPSNDTGAGGTGQTPALPEAPVLTENSPAGQSFVNDTGERVMDQNVAADTAIRADAGGPPAIIVASMADPEQQLLGTMLVTMLRSAGYPVIDRLASGTSPDLRARLEKGVIDLYPEFTGVALSLYHNIPPSALPTTADGAFSLVKSLDEALNIVWIRKASFDSAYALAASARVVAAGIRTLSELAAVLQRDPTAFTICVDDNFLTDAELGLTPLADLYQFSLSEENIVVLAPDEIYRSLRDGTCDIGHVSRSDGRIGAWNLTILEDSLGAFPNYSPAPIARGELLARYPDLDSYLSSLGPLLDATTMTALNAQIELGADGEPATGDELAIPLVATTFLCDSQLINDCTTTTVDTTETAPAVEIATTITPVLTLIPFTATTAVQGAMVVSSTATAMAEGTTDPVDGEGLDRLNTEESAGEENAVGDAASVASTDTITVATPSTFGVNAREAANATANVVAILPRGTMVQAVGRSNDSSWLQIQTVEGELAWVFAAAVISDPQRIAQLPVIGPVQ